MKNCSECGEEIKEKAKFCIHCGAKVSAEEISEIKESEPVIENSVEEKEESESIEDGIDMEIIEGYAFDYLAFLKESLTKPSSIFSLDHGFEIFGIANLIIYSIVLAINDYDDFFTSFIRFAMIQLAFGAILYATSRFLLKGKDSLLEAIAKYGGLLSGQIILFVLLKIFGLDSLLGGLIVLISTINQLLIFNLYIYKNQKIKGTKLDRYYQLIVSYIPLVIMMSFMFSRFA